MSKQLELVKRMSEKGCIENPVIIDLVIKKVLEIPMSELGNDTGSNFDNIQKFLIEDGSRELNEDIGGELNIGDFISISERLSGNDRLYYAYHLANAFRQSAVDIKWIRFFSAVSIKAMMKHLIRISKDLREVKDDRKFYKAAENFNIEISDNTTIGEFLRTAKNKTFNCWLPGTSVDTYTEKVVNGCETIMLLFSGIEAVYCREMNKLLAYFIENEPGCVCEAIYAEPKAKN